MILLSPEEHVVAGFQNRHLIVKMPSLQLQMMAALERQVVLLCVFQRGNCHSVCVIMLECKLLYLLEKTPWLLFISSQKLVRRLIEGGVNFFQHVMLA